MNFFKGHRNKIVEVNASYLPVTDVTTESIKLWYDLPEEIKNDPLLVPFKNCCEKKNDDDANPQSELHKDNETTAEKIATSTIQPHANTNNIDPQTCEDDILETNESEIQKIQPLLDKQNENLINNTTNDSISNKPDVQNSSSPQKNRFLTSNILYEADKIHILNKPQDVTIRHIDESSDDNCNTKNILNNVKIFLLIVCWIFLTTILLIKNERVIQIRPAYIPINESKSFYITERPFLQKVSFKLNGPFLVEQQNNISNSWINIWIEAVAEKSLTNASSDKNMKQIINNVSVVWKIYLPSNDTLDSSSIVGFSKTLDINGYDNISKSNSALRIMMKSNVLNIVPLTFSYNMKSNDVTNGVLYAAFLLFGLYIIIIFELLHRTFAAMLASTMSIAILSYLDERPSTSELISWIDVETLLLLFSMMIIVGILSETGLFDYLAVYAYKLTSGRVWPLINCLCFFTAVMSAFLDNVTTLLLMTPVTIRLCEVMKLNPVPILISMVIFSNIGGTLTPVGDPPNVIIASNSHIIAAGINFTIFIMHTSLGILLASLQTYIHLRIYFRNPNSLRHSEPLEIQELKHEISVWKRVAASLSNYSNNEDLVRIELTKKVNSLLGQLKYTINSGKIDRENYKTNLNELTKKYPIRDKILLLKCTVAVIFVITFFFLHSLPELQRLSLGWTALLGALILLILADRSDMDAVLARIEWSTLLFFAALFILMEALSKMGLIYWIGKKTESVIMSVSEESRLAVAILLILWVSALTSAFVDNIPLTTMMIRIAISLSDNPELKLPLQPLAWALAFGACIGGNGTLIGASDNVVCAGVAEQHGYRISFVQYFKIGFPIMIGSITVITGYLLICHCVFQWH